MGKPPFHDYVGQPTDLRDAPERRDQMLHGGLSPTVAVHTHGTGTYSASYRCFDPNTLSHAKVTHTYLKPNAQGSAVGAELPLTCDWTTEQEITAGPPSACHPLLGRVIGVPH
jgi:hypothetical protein